MNMFRAPLHSWALHYVLLEARLHIDRVHHPFLHRWLHIPDLRLMDALPGFAEEGLRLDSGCPGHFLPCKDLSSADDTHPSGEDRVTRRLRVRLASVAYPYLCYWLSTPQAPRARSVELVALMERGLRVRLGQTTRSPFTMVEPAPETEQTQSPEVADKTISHSEQTRTVDSVDKKAKRARLSTFATFDQ